MAGATAGGGSKSLWLWQHKTVGPSRVEKREIAGPPVIWVPNNYKSLSTIISVKAAKTLNYRTFLITVAQNCGGVVHTEFR